MTSNIRLVLHNSEGVVKEVDFNLSLRKRPDILEYHNRNFVFHRTRDANGTTEYWYYEGETLFIGDETI